MRSGGYGKKRSSLPQSNWRRHAGSGSIGTADGQCLSIVSESEKSDLILGEL